MKETSHFPAFRLRVAAQMADYRQRLAERLEHERTKKSLGQDTLALRAGVSPKTIKRIEAQEVDNPRPVTIRRIAEALGIEPEELRPPAELEQDQLNRIEAAVEALDEKMAARWVELLVMVDEIRSAQEDPHRRAPPARHEEAANGN